MCKPWKVSKHKGKIKYNMIQNGKDTTKEMVGIKSQYLLQIIVRNHLHEIRLREKSKENQH